METRGERWRVPDQSWGSDPSPAADVTLGIAPAVGLLLLVALNLAMIAQLVRPGGEIGRALVVLAVAVATLDLAVTLVLVRPWWPGRGEGATMSRVEQRRQERLAARGTGQHGGHEAELGEVVRVDSVDGPQAGAG